MHQINKNFSVVANFGLARATFDSFTDATGDDSDYPFWERRKSENS